MNETKKTGIFWAVALVTLAIGSYVAWPTTTTDSAPIAGTTLFEEFKDPLAAANLKVVSFDEAKGELQEFVVRKNEGDVWTIQSKSDYPADALEQVTKAANSLIGLTVLDVQTSNVEDHDDLGVVEPDVRELEVGDEGVGRLVTFRDKDRGTLASIIVGDAVKGEPEKRYVRKPGQDPVYVVKFDPEVVTTNFQEWIEEDLLQLSSIEIEKVSVDDYEASLASGGRFSLNRNYLYSVVQEESDWRLDRLAEYGENPLEEPTPVDPPADRPLNTPKLNEMKNALDDLKFVDVYRKPKGIGATLQADAKLVEDEETVRSLVNRGFYPVTIGDADTVELMSANGEMRVATKAGVEYVLRFGNISGVGTEDDVAGEDESTPQEDLEIDRDGVNRFLLVTTNVNESMFPIPDIQPIPKSVDELKAAMAAEEAAEKAEAEKAAAEDAATSAMADAASDPQGMDPARELKVVPEPGSASESTPSEPTSSEPESSSDEMTQQDEMVNEESADEEAAAEEMVEEMADEVEEAIEVEETIEVDTTGEVETSGEAEAGGTGGGQDSEQTETETEPETETESETPSPESADEKPSLTETEWQELLEAEQEKITKRNQRLLDKRRDDIEAAGRKVAQLNERFADWYYVIPESTYRKLRISREALFQSADEGGGQADSGANQGGPNFSMPGIGN